MATNRTIDGRRAFTLVEVMLATALLAFLLGAVAAANSVFRVAVRYNGNVELPDGVIPMNPNSTVDAAAKALSTEFLSYATHATWVLVTDAPWNHDQASTTQYLPVLSSLGKGTAGNAYAARVALEAANLTFEGSGYSIFLVGHQNQLVAALTVKRTGVQSHGEDFVRYQVNLYGDFDTGYGPLYEYEFVSPVSAAQSLLPPTADDSGNSWNFGLPDPMVGTERPDGSPLREVISSLIYALPRIQ